MKSNKEPLFKRVKKNSVAELLSMSFKDLEKYEITLLNEAMQASLAYTWIQGVINLKKAMEGKGHE